MSPRIPNAGPASPHPPAPSIRVFRRIGVSGAGKPGSKHSDAAKHSDGEGLVASGAVLTTDVVIVGAGPAGVAAAVPLARAGRDVVVIDKAVFPRDKCCGDGLTTLALRELELLGFDPAAVGDWQVVDGAVIRSPGGRQVRVPLPPGPGTFAAVAPRLELDAALVDLATKAGATVLQDHGFDGSLEEHADRVVVGVEDRGPVAARFVIAADGMWSPVRRALGAGTEGYLGEWHAFRQYVTGVDGAAGHDLFVWFDADLLPGYAWSFPLPGGRANVGFGVLRDGTRRIRDMKETWAGLLDRPHIRDALGAHAALEGRHTAWPIPARVDTATLAARSCPAHRRRGHGHRRDDR